MCVQIVNQNYESEGLLMEKEQAYRIIEDLRKGEVLRDASGTIRGFLFQDLIAISELLEEDVADIFL